jgi:hypothetical protein
MDIIKQERERDRDRENIDMSYSYNFSTHLYSPRHKESLLRRSSSVAIAEGSYAEKLDSDKAGTWIRTFLINHSTNGRGWSISKETSLKNVYSIVGQPLVLDQDPDTGKADHPQYDVHKSAEANFREQSKKAIGVVKRVFYSKDDDSYYADSLITDPKAKEYINRFHGKKIPIKVSPQIIYDSRMELPNGPYRNWQFSHLAIVDRAAYNNNGAQMIGLCEGDEKTCKEKLQRSAQTALAAASASASTLGYEFKRDTSSPDAYLAGRIIASPANGKRRGCIA